MRSAARRHLVGLLTASITMVSLQQQEQTTHLLPVCQSMLSCGGAPGALWLLLDHTHDVAGNRGTGEPPMLRNKTGGRFLS
jgi:hypothetical protein